MLHKFAKFAEFAEFAEFANIFDGLSIRGIYRAKCMRFDDNFAWALKIRTPQTGLFNRVQYGELESTQNPAFAGFCLYISLAKYISKSTSPGV